MSKVAKRFGINKASVMRWSKLLELREKNHKPATKIDVLSLLCRDVEIYPDLYLQ